MTRILMMTFVLSLTACAGNSVKTERAPSSAVGLCQTLKAFEIHSHRGAVDRPENMMTAFRRAVDLGADWVEMDLQISLDDQVIVAHDAYMKGECLAENGQPLPERVYFREMTVAQIKKYDCGSKVHSGQAAPGERISTLQEVLHELEPLRTRRGQPLKLNLEIKYNPTQPRFYPDRGTYAERVLATIDASGWPEDRLMIQSFDVDILRVIRSRRPSLLLSPLLSDASQGVEIAQSLRTKLVTPHYGQVSADRLREFHAAGIRVIPWTVNRVDEAMSMIERGVDGVITDQPDLFLFAERFCP